MKIIIFGASGGTGIEIVKQALEAGHEVTAFVRNPTKVAIQHPKLKLVTGDVMDSAGVEKHCVHDVSRPLARKRR